MGRHVSRREGWTGESIGGRAGSTVVFLFFLGVGALMLGGVGLGVVQGLKPLFWKTTAATVLESGVEKDGESHRAIVRYRYRWEGRDYTSAVILRPEQTHEQLESAYAEIDPYPADYSGPGRIAERARSAPRLRKPQPCAEGRASRAWSSAGSSCSRARFFLRVFAPDLDAGLHLAAMGGDALHDRRGVADRSGMLRETRLRLHLRGARLPIGPLRCGRQRAGRRDACLSARFRGGVLRQSAAPL